MPGGTGIDLLKAVELQGIKTPVVLVTGVGDANLIDEAMDHGPITLIRKPIRVKQVRQVLEAAFTNRRRSRHKPLSTENRQVVVSPAAAHKFELIGRISSGLAHDLNGPIGIALGFSELAKKQSMLQPLSILLRPTQARYAAI